MVQVRISVEDRCAVRGGRFRFLFLLWAVTACLLATAPASAFQLDPFKDRLFSYPGILERRDDGAYLVVDYRELRDINKRDSVPERRVNRRYVDLMPRRRQTEQTFPTQAGEIDYFVVGNPVNARIVTVYVHGRGGDRKQGVNDFSFGGNFNRIKNLMVRNSGVYITPDGGQLDDHAATRIRFLLDAVLKQVPNGRLVLACGSAGGSVCHALAQNEAIASRMAGIALLGSFGADNFVGSAAWRHRVPVFLGHGSADSVIPIGNVEAFYQRLRETSGYPVRMVRFETGGHGTPIRMTDWRDMINWMLAAS